MAGGRQTWESLRLIREYAINNGLLEVLGAAEYVIVLTRKKRLDPEHTHRYYAAKIEILNWRYHNQTNISADHRKKIGRRLDSAINEFLATNP